MQDYKLIIDSLWKQPSVAMSVLDSNGGILEFNKGFEKLAGKSSDKLINCFADELFEGISGLINSHANSVSETDKRNCFTENIRTWKGNILSLEISVVPLSPTEKILVVIRDKTDYQSAYSKLMSDNKKLNIALENISDGVITTDKSDRIILVNNAIRQILGLDKNEIIGKSIIDLFIMLSANYSVYAGKMKFSTIFGMTRNDTEIINDTVEVTLKDGQKKILLVTSTEMQDNIEGFIGFLYVIRDITEQIKIETQMHISRKMESIGQLAAGIAHEINTPMQYISDNVSFFKESFTSLNKYCEIFKCLVFNDDSADPHRNELQKEFENLDIEYVMGEIPNAIEQTRTGIEKVSKIVLAMKNFAHPGNKDKGGADINQAIKETSVISKNEYKYYADLELDLEENLPMVYCLIDEINQVILNMIINSSHAIKDKIDAGLMEKGVIKISTRSSRDNVEIKIEDTGSGIKPEVIDRIYDPFFTTKEVGKGTGQGLSIAHNIIVKQHHGLIHVDSTPGVGTSFTLTIPIKMEESEND